MLGVAREAWEKAGYTVRGAALSGIAAENLENGSGIASRTIASLEHQWGQGRELLTDKSILVIDEAGMIGTRQMERVITEAEKRGAKVVLVGDPEQLQAIEAGARSAALPNGMARWRSPPSAASRGLAARCHAPACHRRTGRRR
jgi:ATP-dependent exoDNAse (exonuclease V) alpha subunit